MSLTRAAVGLVLLTLSAAQAVADGPLSRWYLPQPVPRNGPWFDGWYTRYFDRANGLTFAVITSVDELARGPIRGPFQGRLTLLVQEPGTDRLMIKDRFATGAAVRAETGNFIWSAPGLGELSHFTTDVQWGPEAELRARLIEFNPAGPLDWGPMGWTQSIRFLPVHWYVATTSSRALYRLQWEGKTYEGVAELHTEKNWGRSFPKAWVWSQGFSEDGQAQYAVSGGPVELGPTEKPQFLWVYRSKSLRFEISPAQVGARFTEEIDPCHQRVRLQAENARYKVDFEVRTSPESFGHLAVPTSEGYVPGGAMESFAAEATVVIRNWRDEVVETQTFRQAALEFGLEFKKCRPSF